MVLSKAEQLNNKLPNITMHVPLVQQFQHGPRFEVWEERIRVTHWSLRCAIWGPLFGFHVSQTNFIIWSVILLNEFFGQPWPCRKVTFFDSFGPCWNCWTKGTCMVIFGKLLFSCSAVDNTVRFMFLVIISFGLFLVIISFGLLLIIYLPQSTSFVSFSLDEYLPLFYNLNIVLGENCDPIIVTPLSKRNKGSCICT